MTPDEFCLGLVSDELDLGLLPERTWDRAWRMMRDGEVGFKKDPDRWPVEKEVLTQSYWINELACGVGGPIAEILLERRRSTLTEHQMTTLILMRDGLSLADAIVAAELLL